MSTCFPVCPRKRTSDRRINKYTPYGWESHAVCAALSFQQCLERISLQDWLLILEVSSASGYKPSAKFVVIGLIVLTSVGVSHGPSCELEGFTSQTNFFAAPAFGDSQ